MTSRRAMRVRLGGAAAALLIACVSSPAQAGAPRCQPAQAHAAGGMATSARVTVKGCAYDLGTSDSSPSVQVTRNGTLFVGRTKGGVLRSTDQGRTWKDIAIKALPNGDGGDQGVHGIVHVDPVTDRVWYLVSTAAASCGSFGGVMGAGAVMSWSDDLGRSWTSKSIGCGTYDWGRMTTGVAPKGSPSTRAVYYFGVAPRPIGGLRQVFRSLDDGRTWQKMANIASSTTESGVAVAAPDGTLYFDYPEFLGFDAPSRLTDQTYPFKAENVCRQMIAVSEDFGVTWRQEALPDSLACNETYGQQRVAVDRAGTVYALWCDDRDGQTRMVVSRDRGRSWSAPVDVMPPGATYTNGHANIVAGARGHVVIAALHTMSPVNPRVGLSQGAGEWYAHLTESRNADKRAPTFLSSRLDPADDPSMETGTTAGEAQAYLGINGSGQAWATFVRRTHDDSLMVARLEKR